MKRQIIMMLAMLLLVLAASILSSCESGWDNTGSNESLLDGYFEDPMMSYSIKYNTNWDVKKEQVVSFVNYQNAYVPEKVVIMKIDMQLRPIPLNEYVQNIIILMNDTYPDFMVTETSSMLHDGDEAQRIVYTYNYEANGFKEMKFLKLKNNKIYIISYTALLEGYDESILLVNKMIDSFIVY